MESTSRPQVFRWLIAKVTLFPERDLGLVGAFGMIATAYLIGKEAECHEALKAISEGEAPGTFRRAERTRIKTAHLKRRLQTVAVILACAASFEERFPCHQMFEMLVLLAELAAAGSTIDLFEVIEPIVRTAAFSDPGTWKLLRRELPDFCEFLEETREALGGPCLTH